MLPQQNLSKSEVGGYELSTSQGLGSFPSTSQTERHGPSNLQVGDGPNFLKRGRDGHYITNGVGYRPYESRTVEDDPYKSNVKSDGPYVSKGERDESCISKGERYGSSASKGDSYESCESKRGRYGPSASEGEGDGPYTSKGKRYGPYATSLELGVPSSSCVRLAGHEWFLSITGCSYCLHCHKISSPGHYWSSLKQLHDEKTANGNTEEKLLDKCGPRSKGARGNTAEEQELTTVDDNHQITSCKDSVQERDSSIEDKVEMNEHKPTNVNLFEKQDLIKDLSNEATLHNPTFLCQHPDTADQSCRHPGGHTWFLSITGLRCCLRCHKMSSSEDYKSSSRNRRIQDVCVTSVDPEKSTGSNLVVKNGFKHSSLPNKQKTASEYCMDSPQPTKSSKWNKKKGEESGENLSRKEISSKCTGQKGSYSKCVSQREGLQSYGPDSHLWFVSIIGVKSCLRCHLIKT